MIYDFSFVLDSAKLQLFYENSKSSSENCWGCEIIVL